MTNPSWKIKAIKTVITNFCKTYCSHYRDCTLAIKSDFYDKGIISMNHCSFYIAKIQD